MKRYDLECGYGGGDRLVASVDGEWIRYEDHVEAMKRIAGDSAQQEQCVCGDASAQGITHRQDGPCFVREEPRYDQYFNDEPATTSASAPKDAP